MSRLTERLSDIAKRCGDLTPIQGQVRQILVDGNKVRSLAGTDVEGGKFAPLAASTLKRRKGAGPPLAPHGAGSREVTAYEVQVSAGPGQLSFVAGWPSLPWMHYHQSGTPRMPRRDPYGFRPQDLEKVRALLRAQVGIGSSASAAVSGFRRWARAALWGL